MNPTHHARRTPCSRLLQAKGVLFVAMVCKCVAFFPIEFTNRVMVLEEKAETTPLYW